MMQSDASRVDVCVLCVLCAFVWRGVSAALFLLLCCFCFPSLSRSALFRIHTMSPSWFVSGHESEGCARARGCMYGERRGVRETRGGAARDKGGRNQKRGTRGQRRRERERGGRRRDHVERAGGEGQSSKRRDEHEEAKGHDRAPETMCP